VFLKKVLLADSIAADLDPLPGVERYIIRGAVIGDFLTRLMDNSINLLGRDAILLHMGTNNVAQHHCASWVLTDMGNMVRVIRGKNPGIQIVISGILPRLVDQATTEKTVKEINKLLAIASRDTNVVFLRSFNNYCDGKEPRGVKEWLFARDGLHLSNAGTKTLHQMFRVQFSDRNIAQRKSLMTSGAEQKNRCERFFDEIPPDEIPQDDSPQ